MTDNEIIKAWEKILATGDAPVGEYWSCGGVVTTKLAKETYDMLNRQKAEVERLKSENGLFSEKCELCCDETRDDIGEAIQTAITETVKEFSKKITEIFTLYAHLHTCAEQAKKDCIEVFNETKIEMHSVWNALSLKKYEIAKYEEMNRLQKNIECISKESLLSELEDDFRFIINEMECGYNA